MHVAYVACPYLLGSLQSNKIGPLPVEEEEEEEEEEEAYKENWHHSQERSWPSNVPLLRMSLVDSRANMSGQGIRRVERFERVERKAAHLREVLALGSPCQLDIGRRRVLSVFHADHVGDCDALGQVRHLRDGMDALKVALGRATWAATSC